jgi:hypothetical protein
MSGPPCSVCSHPRVDDIHRLLAAGQSGRAVAARFDIPETNLRRHLSHRPVVQEERPPAPSPPWSPPAPAGPVPFEEWAPRVLAAQGEPGGSLIGAALESGGAFLESLVPNAVDPDVVDLAMVCAADPAELVAFAVLGCEDDPARAEQLLADALEMLRGRAAA